MERWETARPVPVSLLAEANQYLWIVPVCEGTARWDLARAYQMHPGEMTAQVSC